VRRNRLGYIAFLLCYQVLCSIASLIGYAQELVGTRRHWKWRAPVRYRRS
jgi:biofilm PGA synthesis N-glycosyltransferase PgaC